jgi:hypothetical protein
MERPSNPPAQVSPPASLAKEPNLCQGEQRRTKAVLPDAFIVVRQRIDARKLAETNAASCLDRANGSLRRRAELWGCESTEHEFLIRLENLLLIHLVTGRTQAASLVVDECNNLPESKRDTDAIHLWIPFGEVRAGKDGDLHLVLARVLQRIVFEPKPDGGVESLHLRRSVRDVHGILVAAFGDGRGAPPWILTPGHMTSAELRRVAVAFPHDLLFFGNAWIPFPRRARVFARLAAVDIARADETHAPASAHEDGEVFIPKFGVGLAAALEIEYVVGIARDGRQIDGKCLAQK